MLGEQIGESQGKRTGRRALPADNGVKVEVTFDDSGKMLGIEFNGFGTYASAPRSDGTMFGEGQGVLMTKEGDMAAWKGQGVGRFVGGGAVSYRGALYYSSASPKLARLNNAVVVYEYEVDANGNTHTKYWEWK